MSMFMSPLFAAFAQAVQTGYEAVQGRATRELSRRTQQMAKRAMRSFGPLGPMLASLFGKTKPASPRGPQRPGVPSMKPPAPFGGRQQRDEPPARGQGGRISWAAKFLEELGFQVVPPGEDPKRRSDIAAGKPTPAAPRPKQTELLVPQWDEDPGGWTAEERASMPSVAEPEPKSRPKAARPRRRPRNRQVEIQTGSGTQRFPADHPVVTGEEIPAPGSSNVFSFFYDLTKNAIYIRFLGGNSQARGGPGSLYVYHGCSPEEFVRLYDAASKGTWIWDNLRIRGTQSGHRKEYSLAAISGGYVPRKATMTGEGEAYVPRTRFYQDGSYYDSALPFELLSDRMRPPPMFGGGSADPNTGRPNPPNRGKPNTGRP
jgi:hypothetical protein